jgi:prepilin-type N-terminal cleavage/methylation domain-containing protein
MMRRRHKGFTLVEMIIVVVIIGVLAAIAIPTFKKYMDSGRAAEAMAMLGELRNREEAYRAEFGSYLSTGTSETDIFPTLGSCAEPCAKPANPPLATLPLGWSTIGVNPQKNQLYCGYVVIAGNASGPVSGTIGVQLMGGTTGPATPWWYAVAYCDNNRSIAANTTYATAFNTTVVSTRNEHQ